MTVSVDLAPGAHRNPLAARFAERIRLQLDTRPDRVGSFRRLHASVLLAASDTGRSATLRFDYGRLIIHEGQVGIPWLTLCGSEANLIGLLDLRLPGLREVRARFGKRRFERDAYDQLWAQIKHRELEVFGGLRHPRTLFRLFVLLAS